MPETKEVDTIEREIESIGKQIHSMQKVIADKRKRIEQLTIQRILLQEKLDKIRGS